MVNRMFEIGFLVKSKDGRDKGRFYVIISKPKNNYVRLIDGNKRCFYNPKLKKTKHLIALNQEMPTIRKKLLNKQKVFDTEIYSAINKYKENI